MPTIELSPAARKCLAAADISVSLTEHILTATDQGRINPPPIRVHDLPPINDTNIIDFSGRNQSVVRLKRTAVLGSLSKMGIAVETAEAMLSDCQLGEADTITFPREKLRQLGLFFLPLVSFGVLNGGSASSYYDHKKNREFSPGLYAQLEELISAHGLQNARNPKGIGPAYLSVDRPMEAGFSFLELKLRGWLLLLRQSQLAMARLKCALPWQGLEKTMPVFQMVNRTSLHDIQAALSRYRESPLLIDLIAETGIDVTDCATGVQDLVAALSLPDSDGKRQVFFEAHGKSTSPLGLPGGHGQNFKVLEPIYQRMSRAGKRYAYIGNVDNIGYLPDPGAIALMILEGNPAGFEFSYKTGMDRKGGVLITTDDGRLTCGDIGQAVSSQLVAETEQSGRPILFNCATGVFDLDWLVPNLKRIQDHLPIRFTNQDKDAGRYSQAEQTTWEIIGLIDQPLILAVDKQERFLASKFFLDSLLTSGLGEASPELDAADHKVLATGKLLNQGLVRLLRENYGLELRDGTWNPV